MSVHREQQQQQHQQQYQQHNTAVAVNMNASRAEALLALGYQPQPPHPQQHAQQQQPLLQPKQAPHAEATTDTGEKRGVGSGTAASALGEMMATAAKTAPKRAAPRRGGLAGEKRWNEMFSRLISYRAAHGHCDVPVGGTLGFGNDELVRLGHWVRRQREKYHMVAKGKRDTLAPERIRLLEEQGFRWRIGVGWGRELGGVQEKRWNAMFSRLVSYKAAHGHCDVPTKGIIGSGDDELVRLGWWVNRQRIKYRMVVEEGKRGALTPERIRLLEEHGFRWRIGTGRRRSRMSGTCAGAGDTAERPAPQPRAAPRVGLAEEKRWNDMFSRLVSFRAAHGHCDVPTGGRIGSGNDDLVRLGQWVRKQRKKYQMFVKERKQFSLTPERIHLLEEQGFRWRIFGTQKPGRGRRRKSGAGEGTGERAAPRPMRMIAARGTELAELSTGADAGAGRGITVEIPSGDDSGGGMTTTTGGGIEEGSALSVSPRSIDVSEGGSNRAIPPPPIDGGEGGSILAVRPPLIDGDGAAAAAGGVRTTKNIGSPMGPGSMPTTWSG